MFYFLRNEPPMTDSTPWIRPNLTPPGPVDAVIFDVDGVLFETSHSFDVAVMATTQDLLTQVFGMAAPIPVTEPELRVFRKAGGLNNDWDMAYVLIALRLAGRANSQKELAAAAAESRGRGRDWAREILPRRVDLDYDLVVQIFNEYYWGSEQFERVFDLPARIDPPQPGLWKREVKLLPAHLPEQLGAAGVRAFGIATGRTQDELALVYKSAGLDRFIPAAHIVTADTLSKPDGRVLDLALAAIQRTAAESGQGPIRTAIYCGDTMDDLQAVVNYRGLAHAENPVWVGAVAVAKAEDFAFFQRAGSDAAVTHVGQLDQIVKTINRSVMGEE